MYFSLVLIQYSHFLCVLKKKKKKKCFCFLSRNPTAESQFPILEAVCVSKMYQY